MGTFKGHFVLQGLGIRSTGFSVGGLLGLGVRTASRINNQSLKFLLGLPHLGTTHAMNRELSLRIGAKWRLPAGPSTRSWCLSRSFKNTFCLF